MTEQGQGRGWIGKVAMVLIGLLLITAVILQVRQENADRQVTAPGKAAPAFALQGLAGQRVSLGELKGRVVMVDFWATWCPPCREEMPYLVKLAREFEPRGVSFVAANNEDGLGTPESVKAWIDKTIPELAPFVAFADDKMLSAYRVEVLPTLVLIAGDGTVIETIAGPVSERALRRKLEAAVAQQ